MTTTKIIVLTIAVSLLTVLAVNLTTNYFKSPAMGALGAVDCSQSTCFTSLGVTTGVLEADGGFISAGTATSTFAGSVTFTGTGTTSASFLSTSATKGFCVIFNATSTNTLLNMTFAASTTAATTVGVAPIIRYGSCAL